MQLSNYELREAIGSRVGEMPGGPFPAHPSALGALARAISAGLGRESCPEGSRWVDASESCECYSGRVWMPDGSKCVSPQSPAYQQSLSIEEVVEQGGGSDTFAQQGLDPGVESYLASQGVDVDCRIDPYWEASPAGGTPSMLCSIDGGPYQHGAYAINLNPELALQAEAQDIAASIISESTGVPPGSISSTGSGQALLQRTADAIYRGEQVGSGDISGAAMLHEMELQEQERAATQQQYASSYSGGSGGGYQWYYDSDTINGNDPATAANQYGQSPAQTQDGGSLPGWVIPAALAAGVFALMND